MSKNYLLCAPALLLLACSTPQPALEPAAAIPPPEIALDLPLEPPARIDGAACTLGESCLAMDPRPFEACLVDTRRCVDKAKPPITVDGPAAPRPPTSVTINRPPGG